MATNPLRRTSANLNIGGFVESAVANTFTEAEVNLPLSTLDREVFVVTDVYIEVKRPDTIPATNCSTAGQVTKTPQTEILRINDPSMVSKSTEEVFGGVAEFSWAGYEWPQVNGDDVIAVIATPNFFIAVDGTNNATTENAACRLTGYRAKATADVYAALVTEELNA